MKKLFFIFLTVAAAVAISSPIKSMLGSDGAELSAEDWQNPYITDGLVAMWDAEWNGGFGKHKDSGDWIDCILGIPLVFVKQRAAEHLMVSYEDNYVYLEGAVSTLRAEDELYIRSIFNNNPLTIEVGYLITSGMESTRGYICNSIWRNGPFGYLYVDPPLGALPRTYYGGEFSNTKVLKSRCIVFSGNCKQAYLNGSFFQENEVATDPQDLKVEIIGDNDWGYDFGFYGEIYFIRIYNRALTAEEVAYNYEVDKERFGL